MSARQFWANMPDPSKATGKNEASTRGNTVLPHYLQRPF